MAEFGRGGVVNRGEFAKFYIVAIYREHRRLAPRRSLETLIELYKLPRDDYLEGELAEYLSSQGWATKERDSPVSEGYAITPSGKLAAEMFIDQGVEPDYLGEPDHTAPILTTNFDTLLIPASDRIVSLDHNQITVIEPPLSLLIVELDKSNGIPDDPTFRQRIAGQLKAGRELIRAGEVKWAILQVTLLAALNELVHKYKDAVIGNLATELLVKLTKLLVS